MLEVKFLGQFEVKLNDRSLSIPNRNAQTLFAYLILNPGISHRRELLCGLLWPDSSEESARSNLRHELWRLRKTFGSDGEACFQTDHLGVMFSLPVESSFDVDQLVSLSHENQTTDDLKIQLSIYRGELLPGFYHEWVGIERNRLYSLFEKKMMRLLDLLEQEQRWEEVIDWGTRWISYGQWPEPAYRALMSAYATIGDMSKAAATYERFEQGLQQDLGIKPSQQTQAFYKRLKSGWLPNEPKAVKDADTHSKNAAVAVTPQQFPLPKAQRLNLPRPLTSFIGREKEIQQVENMVSLARLVTITGSGGVGKTRLAIQAAHNLSPLFENWVCWIELAKIAGGAQTSEPGQLGFNTDPKAKFSRDIVTQVVAKGLHVPEVPEQSLIEGVVDYLRDKKLLLVMDNCEHLINACAALAGRLLSECPQVTILTTSREALNVPGEKAWRLPSLSLPASGPTQDSTRIFQTEAVRLFIERAGDILPGFQPAEADAPIIAQICQTLSGIPLAIELAAARMNLLSVREISARLDRRFSLLTSGYRTALPRHQTLQAAIEWSYDLLSTTEHILFRRLSVFAGSFSLESVEAICAGSEISTDEILSVLGCLVDKSLLNVDPPQMVQGLSTRYRFLETIRNFGMLKLDGADETELISELHANFYVQLVERAEPELLLQDQVYWSKLIQAEKENIIAAVDWSCASGHAEIALRLVGALSFFWFSYGSTREGCDLALKALNMPSAAMFGEERARALNTAGFLLCLLGNSTAARQTLEEALSIHGINDQSISAWSFQFLGLALAYDKEYDLADKTFKQGLELNRKFKGVQADNFLHFLGDIVLQKGDRARAQKIYEESTKILRAIGSKSFLAYPLRRLGYLALMENDNPKAIEYFKESLAVNLEIGDHRAVTACLASLAVLALNMQKPLMAARLLGVVENRMETLFFNLLPLDQAEVVRIRSILTASLDQAAMTAAYKEGLELNGEDAIGLARAMIE